MHYIFLREIVEVDPEFVTGNGPEREGHERLERWRDLGWGGGVGVRGVIVVFFRVAVGVGGAIHLWPVKGVVIFQCFRLEV